MISPSARKTSLTIACSDIQLIALLFKKISKISYFIKLFLKFNLKNSSILVPGFSGVAEILFPSHFLNRFQ